MAAAPLDTTILYAAADRSDARHEDGLSIVRGVDDGTLPDGRVVEYVLAETVNGIVRNLSRGRGRLPRSDRGKRPIRCRAIDG